MAFANKMWKEYKQAGGTLSFAAWMDREKKKSFHNLTGNTNDIPENKPLTDSINQVLNEIHKNDGLQTTTSSKYVLGVNRNVMIAVGVTVAVVGVGLIIYHL